jgi:hypothetical protein
MGEKYPRKIMTSVIRGCLEEATVKRDKHYYDIAEEFYDKMLLGLADKNFIVQSDGNIVFKASEIYPQYHDLLILFTDRETSKTRPTFGDNTFKGGYAFGTYKQYKVILINNLRGDKIPSRGILKDSFIHEFIHYLDFKRSKGHRPDFDDKTTISDYYNEPTEYNAYYQEAANVFVNLLKDDDILSKIKEKYDNFEDFSKWMMENVFDKHFIKNLNEKNKRKLKKRIYNIYSEFLR